MTLREPIDASALMFALGKDSGRFVGWESNMMYPYITLGDGTEIVHSDIVLEDGISKVYVHFERPSETGFDSARCQLPSYEWTYWEGSFTDTEKTRFERFMKDNAALIYRYAAQGGVGVA